MHQTSPFEQVEQDTDEVSEQENRQQYSSGESRHEQNDFTPKVFANSSPGFALKPWG